MIAVRGTATASVDAGFSIDVPVPTGTQAGDYLIAHVAYKQGKASAVTAPGGWTLLRGDDSFPDSSGVTSYIYTRVADGTESASYAWTFQDFRQASGGIIAYTGVKTALPIDVTDVFTATTTTAPTTPSIATVYTHPWLLWFLAAHDNISTDTATPPAGMTQRWRVNTSAPGCVSLLADEVFNGPGHSGAQAGAISPAGSAVAQVLFLSPADENPDHPPTASAGPARVTEVGAPVVLDGSGSHDVDPGDTLTYAWTHVSGPNAVAQLSNAAATSPTFTAVAAGVDVYRLTVTDAASNSAHADVTVTTTPAGVRASTAQGLGVTVSVAIPATAQAGDTAFFAMCSRPNAAPPVMDTPGWSAVTQAAHGGSSTDAAMAIFRKRLTAGDLGTTVSASVATAFDFYWTAQIIAVSGLHATAPQPGQIVTTPLASPFQFVNSVVGTPGTATYQYTVTGIDDAGEVVPALTTTVTGAPNTLSNTNYVQISWLPIHRATHYNVYGRSSSSFKLLATVTNANITGVEADYRPGYNDVGVTTGSQSPPTQIPTAMLLDGLGLDVVGTPVPERLFTSYDGGKLLIFTASQIAAPNAASDVADPGTLQPVLTSRDPTNAFILHTATRDLGTATDAGTYVFTPTDFAGSWATAGVTLRPAGTNGVPVARAGYDQVVGIGHAVYLDAGDSSDDDGDTLSYTWAQTSGPTVRLSDIHATFPSFTMPKQAVSFRLTARDPDGLSSTDDVTVTPIAIGQLKVQNGSGNWVMASDGQ